MPCHHNTKSFAWEKSDFDCKRRDFRIRYLGNKREEKSSFAKVATGEMVQNSKGLLSHSEQYTVTLSVVMMGLGAEGGHWQKEESVGELERASA